MAELEAWGTELDRLMECIDGRCAHTEARQRAYVCPTGLLSPTKRNNSWQLAEAQEPVLCIGRRAWYMQPGAENPTPMTPAMTNGLS